MKNEIVLFEAKDGKVSLPVQLNEETVWLTRMQMAELFETDRTSIVRHINNIYKVEELDRESTCAKIAQVQVEGELRQLVGMLGRTIQNQPVLSTDETARFSSFLRIS